jgi:DNA-binding transcriptional LysR family regulator
MASSGAGLAVFPGYVQPMAKVLGVRAVPITEPAISHELLIGVQRQAVAASPALAGLCDALVRLVNAKCDSLR